MLIADEAAVAEVGARLLGREVVRIERIYGGRNSQVYRLDCDTTGRQDRYVAKQYFTIPEDPRDRLQTEYRALQFLRSHGMTTVPSPVALDVATRCAIYEFVPGERASLHAPSDDDVRQAVEFLADLKAIAGRSAADDAPTASEACFSIDAAVDNVSTRVQRLRALPEDGPGMGELRQFLTSRFDPFLSSLRGWTQTQARRYDVRSDVEIPLAQRTLSPSDFGFHNALRGSSGKLVFVDFEYFGWDDPAKTIVDFLHHPAMDLADDQRRDFVAGVLKIFDDIAGLSARARLVYPWFGLKWCLILLNEFVPEHLRRRTFAGADGAGHIDLLHRQLDRASRLLDRVSAEYEHNGIFDSLI